MTDKIFFKQKTEKKINLKAIVCVMLASFMILMSFAGSLDIDAAAETVTDGANDSYSEPVLEIVMNGTKAHLNFKNCINLATAELFFSFDSDVVAKVKAADGEDVIKMKRTEFIASNSASSYFNVEDVSSVRGVFYFFETLWTSEKFSEESIIDEEINGEYFHFATFTMSLKDGYEASDIKLSAACNAVFIYAGSKTARDLKISVIGNEAESESTTKSVPATKPEEETTKHTHRYFSAVTKKADCINPGIRIFTCTCGEAYTENIPSLGGHKLSWTVAKSATSFEEGIREGKCASCDYKEKHVIEKLSEIAVKPENKEAKLSGEDRMLALTGSSVRDLLKNIPENTVIQNSDGKEAKKDAPIATGMKIVMKDAAGKVVDTKTIVVPGDVDCDGAISSSDARETLRKSVGLEDLDVYRFAAADIEQDSSISSSDARTILRASVGLENSELLFKAVK